MKITSKRIYQCGLFGVTEDRVRFGDGFDLKRSVVTHNGSAVILAVDDRRRILLVRQYRVPIRKRLWELPAGKLDRGEKPLQAAKRELAEETGYTAKLWEKLVQFYPSPGFLAEKTTIYLASSLALGEATPMDDERIETRWFSREELRLLIHRGKIEDAKTILGFCQVEMRRRKL